MTKPNAPKAECECGEENVKLYGQHYRDCPLNTSPTHDTQEPRDVCPECGRLYAVHGPPCVAADDKSAGEAREWWINFDHDCQMGEVFTLESAKEAAEYSHYEFTHVIEHAAFLRMKSERDELRKAISQDYISNFHHEKHVDQIRKERDAARAEVEMHKQTIQLCNESMRVDAADVATLNDENERLKATEKVYNMNRDWIDKAKIRIATLEAEDNRNVARIHRQSSIMADVEKENARLREALERIAEKGAKFESDATMDWDGIQDIAREVLAKERGNERRV